MSLRRLGGYISTAYNALASNVTSAGNVVRTSGVFGLNVPALSLNSQLWATDPSFDYTTLYLNADNATNGAQNNTFLDSSTNNFTITRNGNTTQGTFTPFSQTGWGGYFSSTSTFLSIPYNAAFLWSTGSRTFEAWVYPQSFTANNLIFTLDNQVTSNTWELYINTSGQLSFRYYNGASQVIASTSSLTVNTWSHIAFTYDGTSAIKLYTNGILTGSGTKAGTPVTDANPLLIGHAVVGVTGNSLFNGYISNVRFCSAVIYSSAFTPSTTSLTTTSQGASNCSLLTLQNNRFIDNSSNNATITANGAVSVQAFSPFAPQLAYSAATIGGSGYFDGTGDNLVTPSNSAFDPSGQNITVDFWVYLTRYAVAINVVFEVGNTSVGDLQCTILNTGAVRFTTGGNVGSSISGFNLNSWNYITCVKSGTSLTVYLNAVAATSATLTPNSKTTMYIGSQSGGSNLDGYISNFRYIRGSANVPTSVPTAPLTAITNTSLLLNFTNAGIVDSTSGNALETVGNAQISTNVKKYGSGSLAFDGTGDWLTMPNSVNLQMGSGDFTIEGWVYLTATGVAYGIVSKGTATTGWSLGVTTGNLLQFSYTATSITGVTALTSGVWNHVAVVRSGTAVGNLKIYLNGVSNVASAGAVTDNFNQTDIMYVGASRTATTALNGYIDDLRITKLARYTANFTPPRGSFPVQ